MESLRDAITPHLLVTELRSVAADDLWMSMAYKRRSLAIHFTWKPEPEAVSNILPQIEAEVTPILFQTTLGQGQYAKRGAD